MTHSCAHEPILAYQLPVSRPDDLQTWPQPWESQLVKPDHKSYLKLGYYNTLFSSIWTSRLKMFVGSGVWSAPAMVATSGEGSCQTALDDKAFFYFQSDDVPTQFFAPQETYEGDLGVLSKARCELPKLDVYKSWHYHENVEEYERVWKLCKPGTQPHSVSPGWFHTVRKVHPLQIVRGKVRTERR